MCEQHHAQCIYLDARNIDPSPEDFISALRQALDLKPHELYSEAIASFPGKFMIMLDTYEAIAPLDSWLRDTFLPQLPENVLVVISGRNSPSQGWRSDPGWQTMIRTLPLRNLSPEESRAYLLKRHIPPEQHQAVLDFTHGHPLALSLVADVFAQRGEFEFKPEDSPDVVKALLEQLVQQVPQPCPPRRSGSLRPGTRHH
jgi:hypothetical protein